MLYTKKFGLQESFGFCKSSQKHQHTQRVSHTTFHIPTTFYIPAQEGFHHNLVIRSNHNLQTPSTFKSLMKQQNHNQPVKELKRRRELPC